MAIPSPDLILEAVLVLLGFVWLKRIVWIVRFKKTNPPLSPVSPALRSTPKVSVIIPARNEEKNIANCLTHILAQSYPNYEVIVVDDRSTDRTPEIIEKFNPHVAAGPDTVTRGYGRISLRVVRIEKLPTGWTGKNYAMFAGSRVAAGEWLLFTDADTTHRPESLVSALSCALEKNIDLLTLAPETESKSFWEKTIQPLASSSLAIWFSPEKINDPASQVVLANGQFMLIRKDCYEKTGGNESVKIEVVEDVAMARKVKREGYRVAFLNGIYLYSTRMYSSLKEIKTGWTRILIHLFDRNIPVILHKIFLFLFVSLFPYFVLAGEIVLKLKGSTRFSPAAFALALALCGLISIVRFVGNKMVRSNPWYGLLHPLGSLLMVWILSICVARIALNRPSAWRGGHYR